MFARGEPFLGPGLHRIGSCSILRWFAIGAKFLLGSCGYYWSVAIGIVNERAKCDPTRWQVAVGKYVSDLERGDVLGPVEYTMSPFVVREYCHANELHHEFFQGVDNQVAPPTLVHLDKLRLYRHACPLGTGPDARIHYEFDATIHDEVPVGERLTVVGKVTDRYTKRGRDYVVMEIDLRAKSDNRLLVQYRDTAILAYRTTGAADAKAGAA
jgi:hypothetical protein